MWADDPRTTEELFQASLQGDYEDEAAWDAVAALRLRNTEEVFRFAVDFVESTEPLKRARGLAVLAQLGARQPMLERPHFDESVEIAIEHLYDPDPLVIDSAAWALAHLGGDSAVSALIPMRNSADPDVRLAVSNGLNGTERVDAIAALIELMDDPNDNVRDWATFALGTQCSVDSPEIREALRKRLSDTYTEARDEAVWGLAQHKDPQGIKMLIERLSADEWIEGDEMAAAKTLDVPIATPAEQLCDGLRRLLP
jgi:HEAT repeat protein